MKLIIAVVLLSVAMVFAQTKPQCTKPTPTPPPTPAPVSTVSNTNTNTNQNANQNTNTNTANSISSASSNSTSTSNANSSASNNGSNVDVQAAKIPAATAYAPPIYPTVPCFKGMGVGVQSGPAGVSFGGGKVDQGCDDRELARAFQGPQTVASCKILLNTKKAKKAGITMEDCLGPKPEPVVEPRPELPVVAPVQSTKVDIQVEPIKVEPIVIHQEVTVTATKAQVAAADHTVVHKPVKKAAHKPCPVTVIQQECPVKVK